MNNRIKELAEQATETVRCGLNGTSTTESFNRKKFAELIVKTCMSIADLPTNPSGQWNHLTPSQAIAKYFGVEE